MINDNLNLKPPVLLETIVSSTRNIGFSAMCEEKTGSLLKTLAGSKPGGNFLEIGTGTGVSTAWILDGMDENSTLISVEKEATVLAIAKEFLGNDTRVKFVCQDGSDFIKEPSNERYDFIFADTWPGKFTLLDETLGLLKQGGLYIIDDLLPQANWPMDDHPLKVRNLIHDLEGRPNVIVTKLNWASGLIIAVKR
jgi:predicted O-methyltransferase YrrM